MTYLRLCPELRSSVLEAPDQSGPDQVVFWDAKADLDPALLTGRYVRCSYGETVRALAASEVHLVEVPEPLWLRAWARTYPIVIAALIIRRLHGRRRPRIVTYAIDNLPISERGFGRWTGSALRALRITIGVIDFVVFGTSDARSNYEACFPKVPPCDVVWASLGPCPCLAQEAPDRRPVVLFVGELEQRKGVPTLLAAWSKSRLSKAGHQLHIVGDGPLAGLVRDGASRDASVVWHGRINDRARLHGLYRTSAVVVQPSERHPRWREQLGLGALEGESHSCQLVVSDESGMADALARRSQAIVVRDQTADRLAEALVLAVRKFDLRGTAPAAPPPSRNEVTQRFQDW